MKMRDIIGIIFSKKDPLVLAEKGVEQVQETIENAEEDAVVKDAIKVAIETFENLTVGMSPKQKGEFLQGYANSMIKKEEIPNDVSAGYISSMLEGKDIPNEYILRSAKDLPDSELSQLTQNTSIPIDDRKELLGSIEDEKVKQKQQKQIKQEEKRIIEMKKRRVIDSLEKIYNKCDKIPRDSDVSDQIYNILYTVNGTLTENARYLTKEEIEREKAKIVAKRIAHNMNRFGHTQLHYLSQILSAKDMKRLGVISMAINEYCNIEEKKEGFYKEELAVAIDEMESETVEEDGYNEKQEFEKIRYKLLQLSPEERKNTIEQMNDYLSRKINEKNSSKPNFEDNGPGNNVGPEI